MRKPVIVDTPYPTAEQTAKKMGISPKRAQELTEIAREIYERREKKRLAEQSAARKKRLKTA